MSEIRKSLNHVLYGGMATEAMNTFASGPLLIAYALMFKANSIIIGLLGSVEFIGWLSHFWAAYLISKGKSPKKISIHYSSFSRIFYLFSAALAFFYQESCAAYFLLIFSALTYLVGGVAGGAFYPWIKAFTPSKILGIFFAQRYKWMCITSIICTFICTCCLDFFEKNFSSFLIYIYSVFLCMSSAIGYYGVYTLTQVQDAPIQNTISCSFLHKIGSSFRVKSFRLLCSIMGLTNFFVSFITPFLTVFALKVLNIPMHINMIFVLISQIIFIISTKYWGKMIDRYGAKTTLTKGLILYVATIVLLYISVFVSYHPLFWIVFLFSSLFLGLARFAVNLSRNNLPILAVPQQDSAIYLSIVSFVKAIASTLSGAIAGVILLLLQNYFSTNICWLIFWSISIILCLATLFILAFYEEKPQC